MTRSTTDRLAYAIFDPLVCKTILETTEIRERELARWRAAIGESTVTVIASPTASDSSVTLTPTELGSTETPTPALTPTDPTPTEAAETVEPTITLVPSPTTTVTRTAEPTPSPSVTAEASPPGGGY